MIIEHGVLIHMPAVPTDDKANVAAGRKLQPERDLVPRGHKKGCRLVDPQIRHQPACINSPHGRRQARLLAQAFGTTPEFWVTLEANFDLARSRPKRPLRRLRKAS